MIANSLFTLVFMGGFCAHKIHLIIIFSTETEISNGCILKDWCFNGCNKGLIEEYNDKRLHCLVKKAGRITMEEGILSKRRRSFTSGP